MKDAIVETRLEGLVRFRQGKVRDLYEVGDDLLIVATDRISAFDYVLATGIPDKGAVLNQLSAFWFGLMADVVPNHVIATDPAEYPEPARRHASMLHGRSMLVRRTRPLAIECVVRGYLSGSGWKEYVKTGRVCGIDLPAGLRESDRLPRPIFTPSTKAESGHDVNITEDEAGAIVGAGVVAAVRDLSIEVYRRGAAHAEQQGIIVADTKFEFGLVDTPGSREPDAHRRGPDARLVAVLACRRVRPRRCPAQLRQAVRARLPRADRLEQAAAGAGAPARRRGEHAGQVRRGLPAPDRTRSRLTALAIAVRRGWACPRSSPLTQAGIRIPNLDTPPALPHN